MKKMPDGGKRYDVTEICLPMADAQTRELYPNKRNSVTITLSKRKRLIKAEVCGRYGERYTRVTRVTLPISSVRQ